MHLRLNRFIGMDGAALAASLQWFQEEGLPALQRAPSYKTIFFGVDLEHGRAAGITFWDSQKGLTRGETVEGPMREEALRRAGGSMSKGLVDTYSVWLSELRDTDEPLCARLLRWEGLTPDLIRGSFDYFCQSELPRWEAVREFSGMFMGANVQLGNTMCVALWTQSEIAAATELETAARERLESLTHGPMRPIMADTYQVALVPELPALEAAA